MPFLKSKEQNMNENEKRKFKLGLLFVTCVVVIYAVIINLSSFGGFINTIIAILSPLLSGILLSLILGTPMRLFEKFFEFINKKSKFKRKLPEGFITITSVTLTYLCAMAVISFIIGILIPALSDSVTEVANTAKKLYPKILEFMSEHGYNTAEIKSILDKIDLEKIIGTLSSSAETILDTAINTVNGIISLLANLVTTVIFSIYILSNKKRLHRQSENIIKAYLPEKYAHKLSYIVNLTIKTFSKFFSGQCIEAIILGSIFFVAMSIFGFPYAPVISVIIGITAFIPYVGAFIGCFIGVLLILMISPMKALLFVIMFLIIQQLENNLIYPRVVGTSVGLPAMWTFAALIIGGALYGVVGMLVFIPAASVIYTLLKNDVYARLKAKKQAEAKNRENADQITFEEISEDKENK